MAKSDARFGYQADLGRQDHDLSQRHGFTCAPGMLLPIWYDFATPGDGYYMQHDLPMLRSQTLAQPAMIDVKVHYETFFVPIQMLYQPAENELERISPIQSTAIYSILHQGAELQGFPLLNFSYYLNQCALNNTDEEYKDAFRLLDFFELCPDNLTDNTVTKQSKYAPNFFPWQFLAYNTIYQYYYRLDDKNEFQNRRCNWDYCYDTANLGQSPVGPGFGWMDIHQRPWDFDYFTSMYRSPIISSANTMAVSGNNYSVLNTGGQLPVTSNGYFASNNDDIMQFSGANAASYDVGNQNLTVSTAMIRQLFANEKLSMITGRTKKNYDSQVLAHYGVKVPHDVKHDITMIYHDEYDLFVQEVTSLSSTSDAPLGDLAGKSYSRGNGDPFKFVAPCHGVMMTIFSVEPKRRYIGGFNKLNAVSTYLDFPIPEYDRLGNVPMFRYECGYNTDHNTYTNADIIGWKERYYANKRKHDRASMAFDILGSGTNPYSSYMLASRPFAYSYVDAFNPLQDQRPDQSDRFYIDRGAMDNLCLVPYQYGWEHQDPQDEDYDPDAPDWNKTPWLAFASDPFIVDSHVKCKKVSWMSKDGEPVYNF